MPIDLKQSLDNLKLERDAIALYDALAAIEKDPRRADAFRTIAGNERRHAEIWATKLRELGADVPPATGPRLRVRVIVGLARILGTHAVKDLVQALEGDEEDIYMSQGEAPEVEAIAADEREHAEIWKRLSGEAAGPRDGQPGDGASRVGGPHDGPPADAAAGDGGAGRRNAAAAVAAGAASHRQVVADARGPEDIASQEKWHRAGQSGTLRATIFGVSDGLVSNLALVMGVAGAATGTGAGGFVLLAGIAGLLAGAFSMAAGEYISMQSQRELFERQIELEKAELEAMPEEEEAELAAVYRSKGFTAEEARNIAHRMFADPQHALDSLVREELGLDPDELGSPIGAATGSFIAFAIGAVLPVIPYLFGAGMPSFLASLGLSLVALFAVGAGVSLLTGRSLLFSGFRQVAVGAAAAGVTYLVGTLLGVGMAG